ncbi:MAG: thiol reductant ABC exporter subunit CydD, partial [Nocardioidaceae bacterium]
MRPLDPRLLPHLAPARRPLAGMLVAGVANGLLLVAQAFALGWLVAAALGGDPVLRPAVALAATVAGRALASAVVDVCAARAGSAVSSALRRRVLAAALRRPSYDAGSTGGTALLATRGMTAVEPYLTRYLPALLLAAVLPAATVVAIATQDWLSALVVVLTLPLVPVFAILLGLATRNRADRQWRQLAALSGHFVDVVRGLPTLVAYRRAEAQSGRIREITHRYRRLTQDTLRLAFASSAVLELVATLSVALVAVTVGLRLAAGAVDLRTALVVLLLAPEAYWPLRRVGAEFHAAAEGTATFERAAATTATAAAPPPVVAAPDGALVLTDATAGYPGRPVLAGTSVRVAPRGLTAVTGPSGCGKSTLLAVLTGQLPVSAGSLGVPAPDLATWQAQVAWLPQRPWLVPGSVRANVCLGRPDANDAEVWRALERVHLADHVAMLPDGLDAALGEDGAGFSAGERARLALARVVVADRPWVFLDEPTAHLDADTEAVVAQTLTWLARTRAVVVVAHRESLVALADHVVTLAPPVAAPVPAPAAAPPPPVTRSAPPAPPASPASDGPASSAAPTAAGPGPGPRSAALPVALGAASAAAGVALTATAGWLIARAAEHPPVLMLMVAIVGVRTFGLARPVLRYAERLLGHDRALALLAERRAQVYDALVPLVPGRLGRRRGDVLAGVVDDVDALLDRELRVRAPVWTGVLVGVLATAVAAWLLPAAGAVVAAGLLVGGAAYALARRGARDAEPAYVAARAGLSDRVTTALQGAPDLVMWQAVDGALDRVDASAAAMATAVRRSTAGLATGRAAAVLAPGAGGRAVVQARRGP